MRPSLRVTHSLQRPFWPVASTVSSAARTARGPIVAKQVRAPQTDDVRGRAPGEDLERRVGAEEPVLAVLVHHDVRHGLEQSLQERVLTGQFPRRGLPIGPVPVVDDHRLHARVVEPVHPVHLDHPQRTVGGDPAERVRHVLARPAQGVREAIARGRQVVRVNELQCFAADHIGRFAAEDRTQGRGRVQDGTALVHEQDAVAALLHQRAEPLLALPQRLLGAALLGHVVHAPVEAHRAAGGVAHHMKPVADPVERAVRHLHAVHLLDLGARR